MPWSPLGPPDLVSLVAPLRYVLVLSAALWALRLARGRPAGALLAALVFVTVATGFWVLALGRPYGLLVDPDATRRSASIAVAGATGQAEEGFLAGERTGSRWAWLAAQGVPAGFLHWLPSLLPLLVPGAVAGLVALVWRPRDRAVVAALLWLAFSTGDVESLTGAGVLGGLWSHPAAALAAVGLVAGALAAGRLLPTRPGVAAAVAAAVVGGGLGVLRGATPWGVADALRLLTLDSVPWSLLAVLGLRRRPDAAASALAGGGAGLVLCGALGAPIDGWGAHLLYRVGLLLAAAEPVAELGAWVGERLGGWRALGGDDPGRRGLAALLLLTVPGAFTTWWNPTYLDPVARESLEPLSPPLVRLAAWIRDQTPPTAVFLASPDYAPSVAALAGRRVLRAPSLGLAGDDERRLRVERAVVSGRAPENLVQRYGLTHVLVAPGDFRDHGLAAPEALAAHAGLVLRYADADGLRVYQLVR